MCSSDLFTLQDSGIVVTACQLGNMWARFLILLTIKPVASYIAYLILRNRMALTLLGKETFLGKSRLVEQMQLNRKHGSQSRLDTPTIDASPRTTTGAAATEERTTTGAAATEGRGSATRGPAGASALPTRLPRYGSLKRLAGGRATATESVDEKLKSAFNMTAEQRQLVDDELSVAHLDYSHLAYKIVNKNFLFFMAIIYVQLVAVFTRFTYAPIRVDDITSRLQIVPEREAWIYVPPTIVRSLDTNLLAALNETTVCTDWYGWGGWPGVSRPWVDLTNGVPVDEFADLQQDFGQQDARQSQGWTPPQLRNSLRRNAGSGQNSGTGQVGAGAGQGGGTGQGGGAGQGSAGGGQAGAGPAQGGAGAGPQGGAG